MNGKMKSKKLFALIAAAAVILLAIIAGIGIYNTTAKRLARQLKAADKYLAELDYEQAIIEFEKAIGIEPKNVEAYLGMAEAYEGLENIDKVIEVLEKGYEITGDDKVLEALQFLMGEQEIEESSTELTETEESSSEPGEEPVDLSEETLRKILTENVSAPVLNFIYDDFDRSGTYEAVAFCGEYYSEDGTYSGTLYFVSEQGIKTIQGKGDYWNSGEVFDVGDTKIICLNMYSATSAVSLLYQIDGDNVRELAGSGEGCGFSQDDRGRIYMTDSQYDALVDGTGHTWNTYYFYWDGGMREYGGIVISKADFSAYSGADTILQRITGDGYEVSSILERQNGIININCCDGVNNSNVRVSLENEKVVAYPIEEDYFYEGGIIKEALIPKIATYSDKNADKNAKVYGAYDVILNRYREACAISPDNWAENAGNYPDLHQYVLEWYHIPNHYEEDIGDEPYEIVYAYYDIDGNGIPELILTAHSHEPFPFAIYS